MISGQVIVLGLHIGEGPETVIKVTFNTKSWLCSMYKLYILVHVLFLNATAQYLASTHFTLHIFFFFSSAAPVPH